MTQQTVLRIHRIYGILLSLSLLLAGICLMAGCLTIYYSGETPYSAEKVAATFSDIAIPVCLFPVLAFAGLFLPGNAPAKTGKRSVPAGIIMGKDLTNCDEETLSAVAKEQKFRKKQSIILLILSVIGLAFFLVYALLISGEKGLTINTYMIRCMFVLLPCLAVPFCFGIFASVSGRKSLDRQWELVKKCPAAKEAKHLEAAKENKRRILFVILVGAAVALIVIGRTSGGAADVLTKAINICTECIGLG